MNLLLTIIDMGFRRVLVRKRRAVLFYLFLSFIFLTISLILVLLIQPNRLLSKYKRSFTYVKTNSEFSQKRFHRRHAQSPYHTDDESFEERERYAKSVANQDVHVVIGYYQGNNFPWVQSENLTEEILNTNMYDPDPQAGKNGEPVIIPAFDSVKKNKLFQINRFNLMASDRIPVNRTLPEVRRKQCMDKEYYRPEMLHTLPTTSIIIVFHNEAWSTLLRTVHSVINRSPADLLKEIILVDDASQRKFLQEPLDEYVSKLPVAIKVLRSKERIGLIKARLMGAEIAQGQVLTFLDAHCETTEGWLEPLLSRILENPKAIVSPIIDIINDESFQYVRSFELHQGGFNWELHFRWFSLPSNVIQERQDDPTQPFQTAVMAGGLFSVDKAFFYTLGAYDDMKIWGGENLELSFRGWMCGAVLEILPCSHVGHLFRKSSPYSFPGGVGDTLNSNLARVALVWMDEWKDFYFHLHPEVEAHAKNQSIESRLELRTKLNCNSFSWYLTNIWPTHFFPAHDRFIGKIRNIQSRKCLQSPKNYNTYGQPYGLAMLSNCIFEMYAIQLFVFTPEGYVKTDDSICLDSPEYQEQPSKILNGDGGGPTVRIMACNNLERQKWNYSNETKQFVHVLSHKCLDLPPDPKVEGLQIRQCDVHSLSQQWSMEPVKWTNS